MTPIGDWEIVGRLLLAALIGGVFGFERELRQKSAGLRTNILIGIGSAVFTVLSVELAAGWNADPARIAAQIVTGIGFLGAGAIMRTDRGAIQGLTTAAMVWVNASLGMAAGAGRYRLAILGALITAMVLFGVPPFERLIDRTFWKKPEPAAPPPPPPLTGA
jgi:putative Mg2+ transporter-C (MgtC) family protein